MDFLIGWTLIGILPFGIYFSNIRPANRREIESFRDLTYFDLLISLLMLPTTVAFFICLSIAFIVKKIHTVLNKPIYRRQ
jgi:hypothetical protein